LIVNSSKPRLQLLEKAGTYDGIVWDRTAALAILHQHEEHVLLNRSAARGDDPNFVDLIPRHLLANCTVVSQDPIIVDLKRL
jgi:hypothetical protein